jgi:signal transduction histidine kinase
MLFTRTIRRKMVVGLALVLVMLIILSLSGLSGLLSYREAVRDLDLSINRAPRRADLSDAIGGLFAPLQLPPPENIAGARAQQQLFAERLTQGRGRIDEYWRRLDALPLSEVGPEQRIVSGSLLGQITRSLDGLAVLQQGLTDMRPVEPGTDELFFGGITVPLPEIFSRWLGDVRHEKPAGASGSSPSLRRRDVAAYVMLQEIGRLETIAQRIPDYRDGLTQTLDNAYIVYRSRLVMVCAASVVAFVLFVMLVRYGYAHIFSPLRRLHQGALRVAHGDFDYRLTPTSNDEMAELAHAFNQMTTRFQEITRDLDRQVRERSNQLVRSERLAGIGFLAAGVAHEVNNPLQAIGIAAESLAERSEEWLLDAPEGDREIASHYLGMIQRESERCQQITRKLLDFARGNDAERSRYDLTTVVGEVLSMVRHMSKFRDRHVIFERTEPCWALVNGPEIKQVVLNLAANSLEAMDAGGRLTIAIEEEVDSVLLRFEDDGCGMTKETLENLFEPFYTCRKDGKGTGLGMSISQRIIGDHDGTIEAHSPGPGMGSTFLVHLPRRPAAASAA